MSTSQSSANKPMTELPERRRMYLHGVEFRIFIGDMPTILSQHGNVIPWNIDDFVKIKENVYFLLRGVSQHDFLTLAGHKARKIDYAVPQEWFDLPETKERRDKGDVPFWSYEKAYNWGQPLWMSEIKEDLKIEILAALPEE